MKKKILVINNSFKISGAEISLLTLLKILDSKYSFTIAVPKEDELHFRLKALNYNVMCFKMERFSKRKTTLTKLLYFINVFKTSLKISLYVLKNNIDLIYVNSNQSMIYSILIPLLTSSKIIWHVRDRIENRIAAKIFTINADKIICISKYIYNQLPYNHKKILIYNGIDTKLWSPSPKALNFISDISGINNNTLLIGQIGQLIPWKNHIDFINMAELALMKLKSVHFFIIGEDLFNENSLYLNQIKEIICEKGLSKYISFIGYQHEIINYINQIDILVHCAINEPFGRVIMEAMSLQKAVIAYNSGGVNELVINDVTGFLIEPNDYTSLSESLLLLLENKILRNRFGLQGRKEVQKNFSIEGSAKKIEEVINLMI